MGNLYVKLLNKGSEIYSNIKKLRFHGHTQYSDILIYDTSSLENILVIDGLIRESFKLHKFIKFCNVLPTSPIKNILLLGAGDGILLNQLIKNTNYKVTAIEQDHQLLEIVDLNLASLNDNVYKRTDCYNLLIEDPYKFLLCQNQSYDAVILNCPIKGDLNTLIGLIRRVLVDGGEFTYKDFDGSIDGIMKDQDGFFRSLV